MIKTTPSKEKILNGSIYEQLTTAPIEAARDIPAAHPIWIRLPKSGRSCPYTGLSRSAMNALILGPNPPVKSVSLKRQYAIRGTRLVHLGSLLEYIESVAAAQQTSTNSETGDPVEDCVVH